MDRAQLKRRELSSRSLKDPYKKQVNNKRKIHKNAPKYKVSRGMKRAVNSRMKDNSQTTYLSLYRIVLRYLADTYNIKPVEAEFLIWAHSYEYYTVRDAMDLFLIGKNLERINMSLKNKGLIVMLYGGYREEGLEAKWCLEASVSRFIARYVYGIIEGRTEFPNYF